MVELFLIVGWLLPSQQQVPRAILFLLLASLVAAADLDQQMLAIQAQLEAGDLDRASLAIDKALQLHPRFGGLFNLRGIVRARRNQIDLARADFAQSVRFSPALIPAWDNLAHACQSAPPRDPACSAFRSLSPAAAHQLAQRDDFTEADFAAIRASLAPSAVIPLVEALDARGQAGVFGLRQLAIAQEQLHQLAAARRTLERVATLDPHDTAHLLELARLADLCHDEEGALGYLAHARDLEPGNARIHYLFAMIASKMNLPLEARASLQKALAIAPNNPDYNYAMGFVLLSTRDAATSASYFEKFVAARPDNIKGHYALGIAYYSSGDFARSKQQMIRASENPSTAGAAEYFLGRMARQEDQLLSAKEHLARSIQLLPNFAESHTELARVLMDENNLPAARAELDRALRIDPSSFQANTQLLAIYRRTKDPRAPSQEALLKKLDEQRSRRAELMLRTIEARPEP
ncbi:MAG TPA: tetratricopeptide repeat protein [Bryobacteraceae bacterium]|nr:tetratricopeptide repeat protein [Bryobacteraceae bacterium]